MPEPIKNVSQPSKVIPTLLKSANKRAYLVVFDSNHLLVAYGPTLIEEVYPDQDDYAVELNHFIIRLRPFTICNYVAIEVKNGVTTLLSLHPLTGDVIESKPVEIHVLNKVNLSCPVVPVLTHYQKTVVYSKVWEPKVKNHIRKEICLRLEDEIRENGHHQAHREFIAKFANKKLQKKLKIGDWEGIEIVSFYTCDPDGEIKYHYKALTMFKDNVGKITIDDVNYNVSRAVMRGSEGNTYWIWDSPSNKWCSLYNMLYELTVLDAELEQLKEIDDFQNELNQKLEVERFERKKMVLKTTLNTSELPEIYEVDNETAKETKRVYENFLESNYESQI